MQLFFMKDLDLLSHSVDEQKNNHNFSVILCIQVFVQMENQSYYMTGSVSGQDGAILPTRDFSLGPARSKIIFGVLSHIINSL